jgi:hypothetical protein
MLQIRSSSGYSSDCRDCIAHVVADLMGLVVILALAKIWLHQLAEGDFGAEP